MNFLQMSFSGAVIIAITILLRFFFLNRLPKETFLFLWGIALFRLLLPFSVSSDYSIYSLLGRSTSFMESMQDSPAEYVIPLSPEAAPSDLLQTCGDDGDDHETVTAKQPFDAESFTADPDEADSGLPFEHLLPHKNVLPANSQLSTAGFSVTSAWLWRVVRLTGMLLTAAYFVISYLRCRMEFDTSLPVSHPFMEKWLEEHTPGRRVTLRCSGYVQAPLTYGIFRPVILMPQNTPSEPDEQLTFVLTHELIHIYRGDAFWKLLLTLSVCLHWFNPFVWAMYILANRDLEISCDEAVIRRFGRQARASYARTLIFMEERQRCLRPFCNSFSHNALEERIVSIMKTKKTTLLAVFTSTVLIVAVAIFLTTTASPSSGDSPADSDVTSDNTAIPLDGPTGTAPAPTTSALHDAAGEQQAMASSAINEVEDKLAQLKEQKTLMEQELTQLKETEKELTQQEGKEEELAHLQEQVAMIEAKLAYLEQQEEELALLQGTESDKQLQADQIITLASGNRPLQNTLTFNMEGMEEAVPVTLYEGQGFSLYVPEDDYVVSGPDRWEAVSNKDVHFWIEHYGGMDSSHITLIYPEAGFHLPDADTESPLISTKTDFTKLSGGYTKNFCHIQYTPDLNLLDSEPQMISALDILPYIPYQDGTGTDMILKICIVEYTKDSASDSWVLYAAYPAEAEEGHGARINSLFHTFEASYSQDSWLLQKTAKEFTEENISTLSSSDSAPARLIRLKGIDPMLTAETGDSVSVSAELEIPPEDSLFYLGMEMTREADGWKILGYGLEK